MKSCRPSLFRNRQFEPSVIVTCVRWYLRFALSLRDIEELMAERGLSVDHTTICRWTEVLQLRKQEYVWAMFAVRMMLLKVEQGAEHPGVALQIVSGNPKSYGPKTRLLRCHAH